MSTEISTVIFGVLGITDDAETMDMDKRLDEFPEWDSMSLIIIINLLSDDFGITVDVEDAVEPTTEAAEASQVDEETQTSEGEDA